MNHTPGPTPMTRAQIAALVAVGTLGAAPVVIGPVMVGGLIDEFALTPRQAGLVYAAEMAGIGLATLAGVFVVQQWNRRRLLIGGVLLLLVAYLSSATAVGTLAASTLFGTLVAVWLIGGLGSGTATATMKAAVAGTRDPDRVFALYSVLMLVFGALAVPSLTQLRLQHGLLYVYLAMASLTVLLLTVSRLWPTRSPTPARSGVLPVGSPPAAAVSAIAALGCYFLGYSGVWPYAERIAIAAGLTASEAGRSVGLGLAAGGIGAALTAAISTRWGRFLPLALGLPLAVVGLWLMSSGEPGAYRGGVMLFVGSSFFSFPFVLGALAALDPGGRVIMAGLVGQSICMAAAPALAAQVASTAMLAVPWQGIVFYALCFALSGTAALSRRPAAG
jgi:hypothetical protein